MSERMNIRVAREDNANNSTIGGRTAAVVTKEKSIRNEMLFLLLLPHCRQSRFP